MFNGPEFTPLEERLRSDASRLGTQVVQHDAAAKILREFDRRRKLCRRRNSLVAVAILFCGAGALWMWLQDSETKLRSPRFVQAPVAVPATLEPLSLSVPRNSPSVQSTEIPQETPAKGLGLAPSITVPFLVTDTNETTQRVIAVGIYVPPRVQRVNLRDLSPLERSAVQRVLGLDEQCAKPTI